MSRAQCPNSCGATRDAGSSRSNQVPFISEFSKMLTKSTPHFGSLSQHSFFSRHNPHPHRVRHIQGLSGRPICMVRDDWFVTSSLYPHPLLKKAPESAAFSFASNHYGGSGNKNKSALFSEAWKDELRDLAAKVSLSSQIQKSYKEGQPEAEHVRRKTQYSAESGRIIPSSTTSYQRKFLYQHQKNPQLFRDQELAVLELLCQILQTDSLSAVQQWLLLAGQREKELVMGMIQEALKDVDLSVRNRTSLQHLPAFHYSSSSPASASPGHHLWKAAWRSSSYQANQPCTNERPERIGGAEVLEVHAGHDQT
ncbi:protein TBATA [Fundulus diaphanus]